MYYLIPVFLGIVIAILGIIMAIFPRISTRRDRRNDPKAVMKTRLSGFAMIVLGILLAILRFILLFR
ncbi:hypothetical protein SAMN04487760_11424 [Lachnospiraceae bacterium G41]|nr:hypothetical protein SAMN04487760_11424 [Lachnospiraceae bacterium G41]